MTNTPGYVYVLINPSVEGLVKIGKTTKDPEERANELSTATGVPTPFIVVYKAFFQDCGSAETYIHTRLASYRISENKEFFRLQLDKAINTIVEAKKVLELQPNERGIDDLSFDELSGNSDDALSEEPWRSIYEMADNHYYGFENHIEDHHEALKLYLEAAKLGCPNAYWKIGKMHVDGEGCRQDDNKAIEYFKAGVNHGDGRCWAEMAMLFYKAFHRENWGKCWKNYFESEQFRQNLTYGETHHSSIYYAIEYVNESTARQEYYAIFGVEFKNYLTHYKEQIIKLIISSLEYHKKYPGNVKTQVLENLQTFIRNW